MGFLVKWHTTLSALRPKATVITKYTLLWLSGSDRSHKLRENFHEQPVLHIRACKASRASLIARISPSTCGPSRVLLTCPAHFTWDRNVAKHRGLCAGRSHYPCGITVSFPGCVRVEAKSRDNSFLLLSQKAQTTGRSPEREPTLTS